MAIDRNGRILASSILFLLAVLLVTNYAINGAELLTYALPLGLALFGLLVLFLQTPRRGGASEAEESADTSAQSATTFREYLPPAPVAPEVTVEEPIAELPAAVEEVPVAAEPEPEAGSIPYALLRDDLVVIDGIGPKIANALYEAGVTTYGKLADETPESLHAILTAAGVRVVGRVETALPTWPHQARYAAHGDFPGLMRYIAEHKRSKGED